MDNVKNQNNSDILTYIFKYQRKIKKEYVEVLKWFKLFNWFLNYDKELSGMK